MSQILFNVSINDLNEIFDRTFCQPAEIKNLTLNNLRYADDLVLVSETSSGLQNCLDRLQEYCDKWRLTVNIKITQTMVVEKRQSSISKTSFTYKNNALDICKSYPYLGTIISQNGQFKFNINELYKKTSRAMYTLLGNVNKFYAVNIKLLTDSFDKMILPICTYNCEVSGVSFFSSKSSPSDFLSEKQCENPIDKLQGSFLKHILSVHSRAYNWVVESETNRNPVIPHIVRRMIGFYNHLKNSESPIIIDSLKLSVELNEEGKTSWFISVKKIGEALNTPIDLLVNSKVLLNKSLNESIEQLWHFKNTLYEQGKLQLYTSLKERPGFENYLNLPNKKLRQAITKLRTSAHKFTIETGRFDYRKRNEKICPFCCDGNGEEMHYLTQCQNSIISRTRAELLETFHKNRKCIHKLTQTELTNAILACQNDDMLSETGLLCLKIQEAFEKGAS